MTCIGFVQEHQEHEHSFAHNILLGSKACNASIATTYGQPLWLSGEETDSTLPSETRWMRWSCTLWCDRLRMQSASLYVTYGDPRDLFASCELTKIN